ncbi:DUF4386 domain-containing protein [Pseudohalocynthiibacter aestuariivivens]|uniref:DUF4386 domain-containing protein n=1 Tax=Pseudohalocynthiibacter aestuariivivens TaxID=1591409 RepID=A0ABV5JGY5_9RHOB|nr:MULTISPECIES: DUF4386 domain-containing protein [Pseudohalocynthiibacter]MBS9718205.1 DUF4386 domain-containing protein [Pseudohalocynthiibacter aestuariivivens]MCK0103853.1 DUF4386 domain-containing protein [Pseudohalocynthiibacter sp. F2068]
MRRHLSQSELSIARFAGLLYLAIIVFGISSEVALRGPLIDLTNAESTAKAILTALGRFRLSIAFDLIMALADTGLAVLLFILFRPVAPTLALAAMIFRLVQSVIIASNLMNLQSAVLLISAGQDITVLAPGQAEAMATLFLNLHGHGYDLGLVFFGLNSLMTGALIWRSGFVPKVLGAGIAAAGIVYLIGSALRFFVPEFSVVFAPAYGVPAITETAFCLWLLAAGWASRRPHLASA